ncbi:DNA-binding protein [alpha proteobacterium U9-1i]|nr:DNA-binding protein [alpha proteobacterium U9-1i]
MTSFALDVEEDAILGDLRGSAEVAFARQVAMYLCYVAFELSLTRVAAAFGRDRSTVAYACHTIEDRRDDVVFEQWVSALEMVLRGTPVVETGRRSLAVAS